MRTLLSWISVATCSLFTQVLTFVFSGIGCGYAMIVLQMYRLKGIEIASETCGGGEDLLIGIDNEDWLGLRDALIAGDFMTALTQIPILGWYFIFGFIVGGFLSILIINISTIRYLRRLSLGGQAMAEKLGALPFETAVHDGSLKGLPTIVAQLATDFNLPVPQLFILPNEEGMNAFVIGQKPQTSVLVVTRGLRLMSAQQLRGIIAHELAHIHNGDMVHNMRLLAVELGINSVRHTAEWMLRTGWHLLFGASGYATAMARINWGFFLFVIGLMLWPMGLISSLVGSAVMAMTNRRREMRADRLAAKMIGSWEPIADALKRILGHDHHGRITGPDGRKLGHLMFAQANGRSGGLLGTHPEIEQRIKRADRQWDGVPIYESLIEEAAVRVATPTAPAVVKHVLADLNPNTVALFEDPEAILLTVPALLLFDHRSLTDSLADGKLAQPVQTLQGYLAETTEAERFALIELTLEHVRGSKDPAIKEVLDLIRDVAPANAWGLQCWVSMFLQAISGKTTSVKVKYKNFDQSVRQLLEVISIGAVVGGNGSAELRFQRVWGHTGLAPLSVMNVDAFDFADLDQSVESLRMVPQSLRAELANAFAKALMERNVMGSQEATFVRYLCQRWDVATQWKVVPGFRA